MARVHDLATLVCIHELLELGKAPHNAALSNELMAIDKVAESRHCTRQRHGWAMRPFYGLARSDTFTPLYQCVDVRWECFTAATDK